MSSTQPFEAPAIVALPTPEGLAPQPSPPPKRLRAKKSAITQAVEESLADLASTPRVPTKKARAKAAEMVKKAAKKAAKKASKREAWLRKPRHGRFTMPRADFDLIDELKRRALESGRPAKKSDLLRAGLHALDTMGADGLRQTLDSLAFLKRRKAQKPI